MRRGQRLPRIPRVARGGFLRVHVLWRSTPSRITRSRRNARRNCLSCGRDPVVAVLYVVGRQPDWGPGEQMLFFHGGRQLGRAFDEHGADCSVLRGVHELAHNHRSRVGQLLGRGRSLAGRVFPGFHVCFSLVDNFREGIGGGCRSRGSMPRHAGPGSNGRSSPRECQETSLAGALVD